MKYHVSDIVFSVKSAGAPLAPRFGQPGSSRLRLVAGLPTNGPARLAAASMQAKAALPTPGSSVMLHLVKAEPVRPSSQNLQLANVAAWVFEQAQRERLPLAAIAKRDPRGPIHWFAANMIAIAVVYGVPSGKSHPVQLDKSLVSGLQLTEDLDGLRSSKVRPPLFTDLAITKPELERYMSWIRTVY